MHISKLKIKNFKCFDEVEINFDPNFNLIIGENNSGKSTIFDALRLWQLAFKKFLKDRTNNQSSSFYASQFFSFTIDDISFLRIIDFPNLFKKKGQKDTNFEISLTISSNNEIVNIPIIFSKTTEGQVLRFQLCNQTSERPITSQLLSKVSNKPFGSDFKEVFLFTYINPIFLLPTKEPLFSNGYIWNKLHEAKANEVIRNILYLISPEKKRIKKEEKQNKLIEIENSIKKILKIEDISFSKRLENEESYIRIFSKNEVLNTEVEINQLGSGTINVLNILSVLAYGDYEKFNLNALMLDEPDSHLHFNHQSRLYKYLETVSLDENKQIFIITHNSSLISQFKNVLFISQNQKVINPVLLDDYLEKHLKKIDEKHYYIMKELHNAKKEKEEVEEKLKEITKPTLYCEGSTDVVFLKQAFEKIYNYSFFNDKIDIKDGNSAPDVALKIKHNSNKDIALIGLLDNDNEGQSQLKSLLEKSKTISEILPNFHYVKKIRESNNQPLIQFNTHLILLPIYEVRKKYKYFRNNFFIEYMFNDETLKNKFGIKLIMEDGETFEKIETDEKGKILKRDKDKVAKNVRILEKEDFKHFVPLFEKIAEIIGYKLPKVEFDA